MTIQRVFGSALLSVIVCVTAFSAAPSGAPAVTAPSGSGNGQSPEFTWSAVAEATVYDLWLDNLTNGVSQALRKQDVAETSFTPEQPLDNNTSYRVWIRAGNEDGWGPWSAAHDFATGNAPVAPPAGAPHVTAPTGTGNALTPGFVWSAVSSSTVYELWVDDLTSGASQVIHNTNITGTTFSPASPVSDNHAFRVWVRSGNVFGFGPWSSAIDFATGNAPVAPPSTAPTVTTPSGTGNPVTPTFTWTAVADGSFYELSVDDLTSGESQVIHSAQINALTSSSGSIADNHSFRAWVRAGNVFGYGPWSAAKDFATGTAPVAPPAAAPGLTAPSGSGNGTTPSFSWTDVADESFFELWVDDLTSGTSQVVHHSNISGLSFTPGTAIADNHSFRAWVRAGNVFGFGPWSAARDFATGTAPAAPPAGAPSVSSPSGSGNQVAPTIQWSSVTDATYYDLWVDNLTTGASQVIHQQQVPATSFTPQSALTNNCSFRIWVRAGNVFGYGSWSAPHDFATGNGPVAPPTGVPAFVAPDNTSNANVTFSWTAVQDATLYDLWVDDETTGTSQLIRQASLSETEFIATEGLIPGHVYSAWVRAGNVFGYAGWSTPRQFLVQQNYSPSIVQDARAELTEFGGEIHLTVLGDDAAGEENLTYTWGALNPVAPIYYFPEDANGTNTGKDLFAYPDKPGIYTFQVTIQNALGYSVTSTASVALTGPSLEVITPLDGSVVGGSQPVVVTAVAGAEPGYSIDFIGVVVDGNLAGTTSTVPYSVSLNGLSNGPHELYVYASQSNWGFNSTVVHITVGSSVPNDNFANAIALPSFPFKLQAFNNGATKEPGEPAHGENDGGASIWFKWIAPADGSAVIETAGTFFDTTLGIYQGSSVGTLTLVSTNDDNGGITSRVSFRSLAGQAYYIAVDGYDGLSGTVVLSGKTAPTPPNDNFADAVLIGNSLPQSFSGDTTGASHESGEPGVHSDSGVAGYNSIWYRWHASTSTMIEISTEGSLFDTQLAVYTGGSVDALSLVGANDDMEGVLTSNVRFPATTGLDYYIAVDGYQGNFGAAILTVRDLGGSNIFPPASVTAEATSPTGAVVIYPAATATPDVTDIVYSRPSGSLFPVGKTSVNITGRANGREISAQFLVEVKDTTPPVIGSPANLVFDAGDADSMPVYFGVPVRDLVTANPEISYSKSPGSVFNVGTTIVAIAAKDEAGNTRQISIPITVQDHRRPQVATEPDIVYHYASIDLIATANSPSGASLKYHWEALPPMVDSVEQFTVNDSAMASSTTVLLKAAGTYRFLLSVDAGNGAITQRVVTATMNPQPGAIEFPASPVEAREGKPITLKPVVYDQFGNVMTPPPVLSWEILPQPQNYGLDKDYGTISSAGVYTAPARLPNGFGHFTMQVKATASNSTHGECNMSVNPDPVRANFLFVRNPSYSLLNGGYSSFYPTPQFLEDYRKPTLGKSWDWTDWRDLRAIEGYEVDDSIGSLIDAKVLVGPFFSYNWYEPSTKLHDHGVIQFSDIAASRADIENITDIQALFNDAEDGPYADDSVPTSDIGVWDDFNEFLSREHTLSLGAGANEKIREAMSGDHFFAYGISSPYPPAVFPESIGDGQRGFEQFASYGGLNLERMKAVITPLPTPELIFADALGKAHLRLDGLGSTSYYDPSWTWQTSTGQAQTDGLLVDLTLPIGTSEVKLRGTYGSAESEDALNITVRKLHLLVDANHDGDLNDSDALEAQSKHGVVMACGFNLPNHPDLNERIPFKVEYTGTPGGYFQFLCGNPRVRIFDQATGGAPFDPSQLWFTSSQLRILYLDFPVDDEAVIEAYYWPTDDEDYYEQKVAVGKVKVIRLANGLGAPSAASPYTDVLPGFANVGLTRGNLYVSDVYQQYQTPAMGPDVLVSYNSLDGFETGLGRGWRTSYDMRLFDCSPDRDLDGEIKPSDRQTGDILGLIDQTGRRCIFKYQGSRFVSDPTTGLQGAEVYLVDSVPTEPRAAYKLLMHDNFIRYFDTDGRLVRVENLKGEGVFATRMRSSRSVIPATETPFETVSNVAVTDDFGRGVSLERDFFQTTFNSDLYLTSLHGAQTAGWQFEYGGTETNVNNPFVTPDVHRYLTKLRVNGVEYVIHYNADSGKVASIDFPENLHKQISYSPSDRNGSVSASVSEPFGGSSDFSIDPYADAWTTMSDPAGVTTDHQLDDNRHVVVEARGRYNASMAYDGKGNLTSATVNEGVSTTAAYSSFNIEGANLLQTSTIVGAGGSTAYDYYTAGKQAGLVKQIEDPEHHTTKFNYDANGFLQSTVDARQKTWLVTAKDKYGNATALLTPALRTMQKAYTLRGLLMSDTDVMNYTRFYAYGSKDQLIQQREPSGAASNAVFDALLRPISSTDLEGRSTIYTRDGIGRATSVKQTGLADTTIAYQDGSGQTITSTRAGRTLSTQIVDSAGRIVSVASPATIVTGQAAVNVTTTYHYSPSEGWVDSVTDPRQSDTVYQRDASGRVKKVVRPEGGFTETVYHPAGWVQKVADADQVEQTFEYDKCGHRNKVSNPLGGSISYAFNEVYSVTGVAPSLGAGESSTFDNDGIELTHTGTLGKVLATAVDTPNRRITQTLDNNPLRRATVDLNSQGFAGTIATPFGQTLLTHSTDGKLLESIAPGRGPAGQAFNSLDQMVSAYSPSSCSSRIFDGSHAELSSATSVLGQNTTVDRVSATGDMTQSSDDVDGKIVSVVRRDENGNVLEFKDPMERTWLQTFDRDNRRQSVTAPDGVVTVWTYTPGGRTRSVSVQGSTTLFGYNRLGQVSDVIDPTKKLTHTEYDALGMKTSEKDGALTTTFVHDPQTRLLTEVKVNDKRKAKYTRDGFGRVTAVTDGNNKDTVYSYNDLDQVTLITHPDGRTESFTYRPNGDLYDHTDRGNRVTRHTFDLSGRVSKKDFLDTGETVTYGYNAADQVVSETLGASSISRGYDRRGRLTSVDQDGQTTGYTYRKDNTIGTKTYNGVTCAYDYLPTGRLNSMSGPGGDAAFGYDNKGRVNSVSLPNNVTRSMVLDDANRVQSMTQTVNGAAEDYSYHFDSTGRLVSLEAPNWNLHFCYDKSGRLSSEYRTGEGAYFHGYTYDNNDNRLSQVSRLGTIGQRTVLDFEGVAVPSQVIPESGTWSVANGELSVADAPENTATIALAQGDMPPFHVHVRPDISTLTYDNEMMAGLSFGATVDGKYVLGLSVFKIDRDGDDVLQRRLRLFWLPAAGTPELVDETSALDYAGEDVEIELEFLKKAVCAHIENDGITGAHISTEVEHDTAGGVGIVVRQQDQHTFEIDTANAAASFDEISWEDGSAGTEERNYTYNELNQLMSISGNENATFSYNDLGELTQQIKNGVTSTYAYDRLNRLQQMTVGADTHTYAYAGASWMRKSATITLNGGTPITTAYQYDGHACVSETTNGITKHYGLLGASPAWETTDLGTQNQQTLTYAQDGTGNITGLIGALEGGGFGYLTKFNYDVFGNVKTTTPAGVAQANTSGPRYRGEYYDSGTDQIYLRNRYYSPGTGRFNVLDPSGSPNGPNRYGYCGGDPVNATDPMGTKIYIGNVLRDSGASRIGTSRLAGFLISKMNEVDTEYRFTSEEQMYALVADSEMQERFAARGGFSLTEVKAQAKTLDLEEWHDKLEAARAQSAPPVMSQSPYSEYELRTEEINSYASTQQDVFRRADAVVAEVGDQVATIADANKVTYEAGLYSAGFRPDTWSWWPQREFSIQGQRTEAERRAGVSLRDQFYNRGTEGVRRLTGAVVMYYSGRIGELGLFDELSESGAAATANRGVRPYEVDTYANLKARELPWDGLQIDHQPSHASNVARAEAELGRPLTPAEIEQIRDQGTAVAVPEQWHRRISRTYGGRNTRGQIAFDAANPRAAATLDSQVMVDEAAAESRAAAESAAALVRRRAAGR